MESALITTLERVSLRLGISEERVSERGRELIELERESIMKTMEEVGRCRKIIGKCGEIVLF